MERRYTILYKIYNNGDEKKEIDGDIHMITKKGVLYRLNKKEGVFEEMGEPEIEWLGELGRHTYLATTYLLWFIKMIAVMIISGIFIVGTDIIITEIFRSFGEIVGYSFVLFLIAAGVIIGLEMASYIRIGDD